MNEHNIKTQTIFQDFQFIQPCHGWTLTCETSHRNHPLQISGSNKAARHLEPVLSPLQCHHCLHHDNITVTIVFIIDIFTTIMIVLIIFIIFLWHQMYILLHLLLHHHQQSSTIFSEVWSVRWHPTLLNLFTVGGNGKVNIFNLQRSTSFFFFYKINLFLETNQTGDTVGVGGMLSDAVPSPNSVLPWKPHWCPSPPHTFEKRKI